MRKIPISITTKNQVGILSAIFVLKIRKKKRKKEKEEIEIFSFFFFPFLKKIEKK
jgi:hypothetical protein